MTEDEFETSVESVSKHCILAWAMVYNKVQGCTETGTVVLHDMEVNICGGVTCVSDFHGPLTEPMCSSRVIKMCGREKGMLRRELELETHEDAVDCVKEVFRSMGGTVLPPNRSQHIPRYTPLTVARDDFMMDFENVCLANNWDSNVIAHPKGPKRFENQTWAKMIQRQVYPHHSHVDWYEYKE